MGFSMGVRVYWVEVGGFSMRWCMILLVVPSCGYSSGFFGEVRVEV